jgi:drug/metabolite transporter (DMT)-like permease
VTPSVAAVVLLAACTHAVWNAIAHGIKDELVGNVLVGLGRVCCGAALVFFVPSPAPAAFPFLLVSAAVHIAYQVLLMRSFRLGDFGQVYPIARGAAPLVVTAVAILFFGDHLHGLDVAGIAIAMSGLLGLALWGLWGRGTSVRRVSERPRARRGPAVTAAVATGLAIAAYTVLDGVGVRASGAVPGYAAYLMILDGLAIPVYSMVVHRSAMLDRLRPAAVRGMLAGAMSALAYGLVLWAQARAPLASVAVLRETSVIVGAGIAAVLFKERFGAARVAAATVMLVGIALIVMP